MDPNRTPRDPTMPKRSHPRRFGYADEAAPLDLIQLRLWLDRIVTEYRDLLTDASHGRHRRAGAPSERGFGEEAAPGKYRLLTIDSVRGHLNSPEREDAKRVLRSLAAAGIVAYLGGAQGIPRERVPEQVLLDLVVFAMWPVITAERLPGHWPESLAELTSPRLAALVGRARTRRANGDPGTAEDFAREVVHRSFARAVLLLCDDLADPRRGAPVLTALAVAAQVPNAERRDVKGFLRWAVGIAAGVAAGEAAAHFGDDLAHALGRLVEDAGPAGEADPPDHGSDGPGNDHGSGHDWHGEGGGDGGEGGDGGGGD